MNLAGNRNRTAPFSEVAAIITGKTPSKKIPAYFGGSIPFVTPVELDLEDPITITKTCLTEQGADQVKIIPKDSVMVSCIGSLGKVGIAGDDLCTNQQINSLVFDQSEVWPRYGYHYCKLLKPYLEGIAPSTTLPIVNKSRFSEIRMPLPELPKQQRIAAILDKADALREKRRQAIAKLDELLQSVFLDMFGDPVTNPKGWPEGTIEAVTKDKSDLRCGPFGTQLKVHELVESGVPLWGIENVLNNRFEAETTKYITEDKADELKAFAVKQGDVLITRMGTIGRACVVPDSVAEGRISYHLFRVRPSPEKCLPEFLSSTISRSGVFHAQLKRLAHGAIMSGLSTSILKEVRFLLPPIRLQERYIAKVKSIERQIAISVENLEALDDLFTSLQQRAFKGEL